MAVLSGSLNEQTVRHISQIKHEPKWMLDIRLKAYREYSRLPMPKTYVDLDKLDINNLCFYNTPLASPADRWEAVPDDIKSVYQQIGLPEAEQKYLAGAQAQYNSGMIYERLKEQWQDLGIIFTDTDTAVQKYPKLVKKYFTTVVPYKEINLPPLTLPFGRADHSFTFHPMYGCQFRCKLILELTYLTWVNLSVA